MNLPRTPRITHHIIFLSVLTLTLLIYTGCAGSGEVVGEIQQEEIATSEPVSRWAVLTAGADGFFYSAAPDTLDQQAVRRIRGTWPSPTGRKIAVEIVDADSAYLYILDRADAQETLLFSGPTNAEYTIAWAEDDSNIAFGYLWNGSKGIAVAETTGGVVRSVGCTASYKAFAVRDDGRLVVGDSGSLYLVESENCATVSTIDLTKRHHVAVSPTGKHVAYIFRQLVFNRRAYSYDPDSTLFIRSFESPEEVRVTSDRYRARNISWSKDGTRLVFDARGMDDMQERQLAFFDLSDGQSGYVLNPGDMTVPIDQGGIWSHSGDAILFERVDPETGISQLAVRHFVDRRLYLVAATNATNPFVAFRFDGDDRVMASFADGTSGVFGFGGRELISVKSGIPVLTARLLAH